MRVSENHRFLVHDDGRPFFYLADTAWELFHRLTLEEARQYLVDRARKRFTVIQAVILAELDGLTVPNMQGDLPLVDGNPERPVEAYFAHVDAVVDLAASLGLVTCLLPTWGDKWNLKWGVGPEIFTPANAHAFGAYVGQRYADRPVIWMLGGDRPIETPEQRAIIQAMAAGVRAGDGGLHLMTFHTWGPHASSEYVHDEPWLDFHTCQSGHNRNSENWRFIEADYARLPVRPCMDAEPPYEDAQTDGRNLAGGYLDDYEVRKSLYWSLFAGAHGHTYGCWPVWQMWRPGFRSVLARRPWHEAIHMPGSSQVQHARALLLSRPYLTRIPDQSLVLSDVGSGTHHVQATRDEQGRCAMVYLPSGTPVDVDLTKLRGNTLLRTWFDPRTGLGYGPQPVAGAGSATFAPPDGGPDWVLVLDHAAAGFPPPGARAYEERPR